MHDWLSHLHEQLRTLERTKLLRTLVPYHARGRCVTQQDVTLLNLAGNDYLGLGDHPHLQDRVIQAVQTNGVGAGASRLVSGHRPIHQQLEERFAAFKHAPACLLLPTGYMANLAALTTFAGKGDLICLDKLNHASLIDAARACGATVRVFAHRDYDKLERLLKRFDQQHAAMGKRHQCFIVTDAVFSMDGDVANLPVICDLAQRYGAVTVVDEAHATGVLGETGAGLCELMGVSDRVDVVVSTASKALGGLGGLITAARVVIDTLINKARPLIYTTAPPPAQVAAIDAALDIVEREPHRRKTLAKLRQTLAPVTDQPPTPIVPLICGSPETALALAQHLRNHGILAPAIRPPSVPPGTSRVRLGLRADLTDADINQLSAALKAWRNPTLAKM